MSIFVGKDKIKAVYVGGAKIKQAFVGAQLVYEDTPSYTVTTAIDPAGSGTATGAGTYQQGASVTVTAAPAAGYKFVGWKSGGTTVSTSTSYTFTVTGDVSLTAVFEAEKTSRLPAGYTEVQYISTDGLSGIKLADRPTFNTRIVFEYKVNSFLSSYSQIIGSLPGSSSTGISVLIRVFQRNTIQYYLGKYEQKTAGSASSLYGKKVFDIDLSAGTLNIGNAKYTFTTITGSALHDVYIGGGSTSYNGCNANIYSCKVYLNGELSQNLVPCIRDSDQTVGCYDLVKETFYANAAGGTFTAGPAV